MKTKNTEKINQVLEVLNGLSYQEIDDIFWDAKELAQEKSILQFYPIKNRLIVSNKCFIVEEISPITYNVEDKTWDEIVIGLDANTSKLLNEFLDSQDFSTNILLEKDKVFYKLTMSSYILTELNLRITPSLCGLLLPNEPDTHL